MMTGEELINIIQRGETSEVQLKQKFTTVRQVTEEMVAFANCKGGIIVFGVEDKTGTILGLTFEEIQKASHEISTAANDQIKPTVFIFTEVIDIDQKHLLVVRVLEGKNKPYKDFHGQIWVKQGSDKRRVLENIEILSLFQDSGTYHADEATIPGTSIKDLQMASVEHFFEEAYEKPIESFGRPVENLLQSLRVIGSNGCLTRAGLMYFGRKPQAIETTFYIKAVAFWGNSIGDSDYRDSRDIKGTIPFMFREGMAFLSSNLRHLQAGQNFNSVGKLEIPEIVLEELLQNALVHLDMLIPATIRLLVFDDRVEIINPGSLYGGLSVDDIKLGLTRERNPLLTDLCSKTMIYRGLGSGIVRVLKENVKVDFVNEEGGKQFRAIIWRPVIEEQRKQESEDYEFIVSEGPNPYKRLPNTQTPIYSTQKSTPTTRKSTQKHNDSTQINPLSNISAQKKENSTQLNPTKSDGTQKTKIKSYQIILEMIEDNPNITIAELARRMNFSEKGIKKNLAKLKEMGKLVRVGPDRGGHWEVVK